MARRHERYRRLEPHPQDRSLERGFRAEIHDPVWFLGRQWQLGEHQGENASSPVRVRIHLTEAPIAPLGGEPRFDPLRVPAEAIVESEAGDWWTMGRRLRLGAHVAGRIDIDTLPDHNLRLRQPPPPYEHFDGEPDGQALWEQRHALNIDQPSFWPEQPPDDLDSFWDPAELTYQATFECAAGKLELPRHGGGQVDWYTAEASATNPPQLASAPEREALAYPLPLMYPGAPHPRWWQIEEAAVDIGGYPPDRSHFATTLLIDLVASHSDDWFVFPLQTKLGHAVYLHHIEVEDIFGDRYTVTPPPVPPQAGGWSLFHTTGLPAGALVLWATVMTPLQGAVLERVLVGTDEDANLLWAVEQRLQGHELAPPMNGNGSAPEGSDDIRDVSGPPEFQYLVNRDVVPYWHPYLLHEREGRRRFVQGRLVDFSGSTPQLMPSPEAALLQDPGAVAPAPAHEIEPATIPVDGLILERRWVLARATDGQPVLWVERQRQVALAQPARLVQFDVLEPVT
jgi:hypothetical protein